MQTEILDFIQRSDAIPSMPQIVTRLLEITRDEDYKLDDIVQLLSTDPGIAGDVLRLANSPLFGVTRKVGSLSQATSLLGVKRIRTLVMGRCLVDKVKHTGTKIIDTSYYWRRSLATGVLAARFADHVVAHFREEAFLSGLLSKVGVIVLAGAYPESYAETAKAFAPLHGSAFADRERQSVGVTHPVVSALVLERWTLPEAMVLAVRHHHSADVPEDLPESVKHLTRVVSGAADIARLLCEVPDRSIIARTCQDAMDTVGLNIEVLAHLLGDIETDISELASILRIDVIPSRVYSVIAKTIAEHLATTAT